MRIANGAARFSPGQSLFISSDRTAALTRGFFNQTGAQLERIDLTQQTPSVVRTRASAEFDGAAYAMYGPGDELLYFSSGIVVNSQTLMLAGFTAEGLQIPTPDGSTVYVLDRTRETLSVFDARTYRLRALYSVTGCFGQTVFAQLGATAPEIIWTAGAGVCRVTVP